MPEASFTVDVVSGVPVVATPEEVDIANVAGLRTALLEASTRTPGTLVVDMSGTEFCDSSGIHVLVRAHKRAQSDGGELLMVVSPTAVARTFAVTGIDRLISSFSSLDEALAHAHAAPFSPPIALPDPSPAATST